MLLGSNSLIDAGHYFYRNGTKMKRTKYYYLLCAKHTLARTQWVYIFYCLHHAVIIMQSVIECMFKSLLEIIKSNQLL